MSYLKLLRTAAALLLMVLLVFAPGFTPGVARTALAIAAPYAAHQVVARVLPGETIEAINADYGTTTMRELVVTTGAYLLATPEGEDAALTIERMSGDPRLAFVEPNYIGGAPEASPRKIRVWGGPDPTPGDTQYALDRLRIKDAQKLSRGDGIIVAVVDTGIQLDHPALQGRVLANGYDFLDGDADPSDTPDGVDDDDDGQIDEAFGHGTHVAGIVLLTAPDAAILPVRALNADGVGDVYSVAMAIEYAVANGAHIINLSLGTDLETALLHNVVLAAARAGVLVVAAAGNNTGGMPQYPAADPCAVGVTSIDQESRVAPDAATGSWVRLAAPGEAIYSAMIPSGYGWWSGTSMAAPFVSGQAALIRAIRPDLGLRQLTSLATVTGEHLDDTSGPYAPRRIDIGQSLEYAVTGREISGRLSSLAAECTFAAAPLILPPPPIVSGVSSPDSTHTP